MLGVAEKNGRHDLALAVYEACLAWLSGKVLARKVPGTQEQAQHGTMTAR